MSKAFDAGFEYGRTVGGILSPSCREERLQEHGIASTSKNRQAFMKGVLCGSNRKPMNARFWIWHNGWTKVTLRPGQKLSYGYGGPTDEGYTYGNESFELEDGVVTHIIESSARDCDGRHDETRVMVCPVHKLRDMAKAYDGAEKDNFGIYAPSWERISERQRDHYAESMGY